MAEVETVLEAKNVLGEGPIWHPGEQALYWCDIMKPSFQRLDPASGDYREWAMPEEIGSMVFREKGGVVAALKSGFYFVDLASGKVEAAAKPEPSNGDNRFNDGKCDRRGRYWCGTISFDRSRSDGALYRLDPDGSCHKMEEGVTVSNGIAWSPDNKVMYYADSPADKVYAYDFDLETGAIANRRVFISTADIEGFVDGATVDAEGFYWCAHIRAGEIARYDPDGKLERTIPLPVQHPTMCTFGGKELDTLYVTSGTQFVKPEDAAAQPLAGALLAIHDVGARGLPEPFFAG